MWFSLALSGALVSNLALFLTHFIRQLLIFCNRGIGEKWGNGISPHVGGFYGVVCYTNMGENNLCQLNFVNQTTFAAVARSCTRPIAVQAMLVRPRKLLPRQMGRSS